MTSSILRSTGRARISLMAGMAGFLEYAWTVVGVGIEYAHELKARRTFKFARVEENRWHQEPALQLLKQCVCAVNRKECAGAREKHHVFCWILIGRKPFGHEI